MVKHWNTDTIDLDKVSKIKLKEAAHEILIDDEPIVLFKSGDCSRLDYVKDKNNESCKGFLPDNAKIVSSRIVTNVDKYLIVIAEAGKVIFNSINFSNIYFFLESNLLLSSIGSEFETSASDVEDFAVKKKES